MDSELLVYTLLLPVEGFTPLLPAPTVSHSRYPVAANGPNALLNTVSPFSLLS